MTKIAFNQADISEADMEYVRQTISSRSIGGDGAMGKKCEAFLREFHPINYALLSTSCTSALEMTSQILELADGDEVIVPSYTFSSTANAFALSGARPIFADVDPNTLNIDVESIKAAISSRTRAIVVVHYGGIAADLPSILDVCRKNNLVLIEDNAHGLFAKYQGQSLGTFGDLSTLSFHATKNIVCGEGGALLTNRTEFMERAMILREKGTDRSKFLRGLVDKYTWVDLGSSWVLSDILASLLWSQLQRFDEIQIKRKHIFETYSKYISPLAHERGIHTSFIPKDCESSYHLYFLQLQNENLRNEFINFMEGKGISAAFHYQPLNTSPQGLKFGGFVGQCPIAETAGSCLVRLPLYSGLKSDELEIIVNAVTQYFSTFNDRIR